MFLRLLPKNINKRKSENFFPYRTTKYSGLCHSVYILFRKLAETGSQELTWLGYPIREEGRGIRSWETDLNIIGTAQLHMQSKYFQLQLN